VGQENYQIIKTYEKNYATTLFLEGPPTLRNDQMPVCNNLSGVEWSYLILLMFFLYNSMGYLFINRRKKDIEILLLLTIISVGVLVSLINKVLYFFSSEFKGIINYKEVSLRYLFNLYSGKCCRRPKN
jgi:membrane-associated HD superfamily phosphohydrolase